ncbi:BTB/POZ domain-containing protein, partial [Trifolium medium]|nr:BTB/POZ domain-containing protein [Trifolium medium]
ELITQQEVEAVTHSVVPQQDEEDEIVEEQCHVTFTDFPGGFDEIFVSVINEIFVPGFCRSKQ